MRVAKKFAALFHDLAAVTSAAPQQRSADKTKNERHPMTPADPVRVQTGLDDRRQNHSVDERRGKDARRPTRQEEQRMREDVLEQISAGGADPQIVSQKRRAIKTEARESNE